MELELPSVPPVIVGPEDVAVNFGWFWESLLTSYPRGEIEMHQSEAVGRTRRPAEGEEPGGGQRVESRRHGHRSLFRSGS